MVGYSVIGAVNERWPAWTARQTDSAAMGLEMLHAWKRVSSFIGWFEMILDEMPSDESKAIEVEGTPRFSITSMAVVEKVWSGFEDIDIVFQ